MASYNKVILMGNLTRDPEMKYIPSGTPVTEFGIAVNRNFKSTTGERKEEVCFIKVVTWSKLAENCGKFLAKGRPVLVEGRLQSRSWETKEGEKRTTIEVVAENVQFLSRARSDETEEQLAAAGAPPQDEARASEPNMGDVPF